jgi:hypothetical protein
MLIWPLNIGGDDSTPAKAFDGEAMKAAMAKPKAKSIFLIFAPFIVKSSKMVLAKIEPKYFFYYFQ